MTSLPLKADLIGTPTTAEYKDALERLYDYNANLFGSDGEKSTARSELDVHSVSESDAAYLAPTDIGTSVQEYDANTSKTDVAEVRSAPINMNDNVLSGAVIKNYSEEVGGLGVLTGGTVDLDIEVANIFSATISTAATTFTFSSPLATKMSSISLFLTNGGSQVVTWPSSVDWQGGTPPVLTTSGLDIVSFSTIDNGATWHGFVASLDSK